jgi:hypothetical protein
MSSYHEEFERIKALHELPTFVSKDFLQNDVLPGALLAAAIITVINLISTLTVLQLYPQMEKSSVYYAGYKIAHFLSNAAIGCMGLYYYVYVIDADSSIEEIATGFKSAIFPIMCVQVGKNLWAIPAGLIMVDESVVKLGHHVSVILVALASASFTMGFSYYLPLMFGVFEISSIPLAMVETFKDNPQYIKKYPREYTLARLLFAGAFLYIRWYLYLPPMWDFLRLSAFAIMSIEGGSHFIIVLSSLTWVATCFLGALQIYWGFIIIRNMIRALLKGTNEEAEAMKAKEA